MGRQISRALIAHPTADTVELARWAYPGRSVTEWMLATSAVTAIPGVYALSASEGPADLGSYGRCVDSAAVFCIFRPVEALRIRFDWLLGKYGRMPGLWRHGVNSSSISSIQKRVAYFTAILGASSRSKQKPRPFAAGAEAAHAFQVMHLRTYLIRKQKVFRWGIIPK